MRRPIFEDIRNRKYWNTLIEEVRTKNFLDLEGFNTRYFSKEGSNAPFNGLYACDYARKYSIYCNRNNGDGRCVYCPYVESPFALCSSHPRLGGIFQNLYNLFSILSVDSSLLKISYEDYYLNSKEIPNLSKTCESNLRDLIIKMLESIRDLPIQEELVRCRSKVSILRFWE